MNRRKFLKTAALGASAAVSGCCCNRQRQFTAEACPVHPGPWLRPAQDSRASSSELIIDVHTHIFNGHDVPMEEYLTGPILHSGAFASKLISLIISPATCFIREFAPTGDQELRELCALNSIRGEQPADALNDKVRTDAGFRDVEFAKGIAEIANKEKEFLTQYRAEQLQRVRAASFGVDALTRKQLNEQAESLQDKPIALEEVLRSIRAPSEVGTLNLALYSVGGIWKFLRALASSRLENATRMIDTYSKGPAAVDLYSACTVDIDSALKAKCKSTPIELQVRIMAEIAKASNGLILPFVGFDPRRDIETEGQALKEVKAAVEEHNHLGVKIYPPIGFRPWANKDITDYKVCAWPRKIKQFGSKLDASLGNLYDWAARESVPILAHTNTSMGVSETCQAYGTPDEWRSVLTAHKGVRICAGHFGGYDNRLGNLTTRMKGFAELMRSEDGEHFYADLGFLGALLKTDSNARRELSRLLQENCSEGSCIADKVMFGTDWFMITQDNTERTYATDAIRYLQEIEPSHSTIVTKVMGSNAVKYLDLARYLQRNQPDIAPASIDQTFAPEWKNKL